MKAFEKIKKNQERRLARKKYEARSRPDFDGELDTSKRRCGACGMVGHTSMFFTRLETSKSEN
jgi:transcription initiation factor TFIID subunit 1